MNFRQVRTLFASIVLAALYFAPLWALLWAFNVERMDVIVGGHALIVLLLLAQYMSGVRNSLRAVNAEPLDEGWVPEATDKLSSEMGVKSPDVYVGNFGVCNAFVVGRRNSGSVVLSQSMLQTLPPEQIKAVLAHEISHLRSHDTTLMMLGEGIDRHLLRAKYGAISAITSVQTALVMKPIILVLVVLRGIVLLPLRFVSRRREYVADRDAADICGNQTAATALENVSQLNSQVQSAPKRAQQVDALCIDGVVDSVIERVLGTHPPMKKRVKKLRK